MACLPNDKHELFARGLAKGMTQAESYKAAFKGSTANDNSVKVSACKLAGTPRIVERVLELKTQNVDNEAVRHHVDRAWVLSRFVDEGLNANNPLARIRAVENVGKMIGVAELSTSTVRSIRSPRDMSVSELRQWVAEVAGEMDKRHPARAIEAPKSDSEALNAEPEDTEPPGD